MVHKKTFYVGVKIGFGCSTKHKMKRNNFDNILHFQLHHTAQLDWNEKHISSTDHNELNSELTKEFLWKWKMISRVGSFKFHITGFFKRINDFRSHKNESKLISRDSINFGLRVQIISLAFHKNINSFNVVFSNVIERISEALNFNFVHNLSGFVTLLTANADIICHNEPHFPLSKMDISICFNPFVFVLDLTRNKLVNLPIRKIKYFTHRKECLQPLIDITKIKGIKMRSEKPKNYCEGQEKWEVKSWRNWGH